MNKAERGRYRGRFHPLETLSTPQNPDISAPDSAPSTGLKKDTSKLDTEAAILYVRLKPERLYKIHPLVLILPQFDTGELLVLIVALATLVLAYVVPRRQGVFERKKIRISQRPNVDLPKGVVSKYSLDKEPLWAVVYGLHDGSMKYPYMVPSGITISNLGKKSLQNVSISFTYRSQFGLIEDVIPEKMVKKFLKENKELNKKIFKYSDYTVANYKIPNLNPHIHHSIPEYYCIHPDAWLDNTELEQRVGENSQNADCAITKVNCMVSLPDTKPISKSWWVVALKAESFDELEQRASVVLRALNFEDCPNPFEGGGLFHLSFLTELRYFFKYPKCKWNKAFTLLHSNHVGVTVNKKTGKPQKLMVMPPESIIGDFGFISHPFWPITLADKVWPIRIFGVTINVGSEAKE